MNNNSTHYAFAHLLRALAALSVIFGGHFLGVFWFNMPAVSGLLGVEMPASIIRPSWLSYLHLFNRFDWGAFGVGLFFLISGFVIPFSFSRMNAKAFLVARFFRIYPTYWVGFTLSWLALIILNPSNELLTFKNVSLQYGLIRDIAWIPSLDGISWTLETEIKFYLLCALISSLIVRPRVFGLTSVIGLLGMFAICTGKLAKITIVLGAIGISSVFIIYMFIGTSFYWHCRKLLPAKYFILVIFLLFICFSLALHFNVNFKPIALNEIINCLSALFTFGLFYIYRDKIKISSFFQWIADISYPLYVIHPVLGYGLLYYFIYILKIHYLLAIMFTSFVVFSIAVLLHKLVEVKSNHLGKYLAKKLGSKLANVTQNSRPFVDKAGVKLNQRGARV